MYLGRILVVLLLLLGSLVSGLCTDLVLDTRLEDHRSLEDTEEEALREQNLVTGIPQMKNQVMDSLGLSDLYARFLELQAIIKKERGFLEEAIHRIEKLEAKIQILEGFMGEPKPISSGQVSYPKETIEDPKKAVQGMIVESVLPSRSPQKAYERARNLLQEGRTVLAAQAFEAFLKEYPKDPLSANAIYWLGVSYFVQDRYEKAAITLSKAYKDYPDSPKTADVLLKLAFSLKALGQDQDACVTLRQIGSIVSNRKNRIPTSVELQAQDVQRQWGCL